MLNEVTIELTTPIKAGDKEITSITLKEPTFAQAVANQNYVGFESQQRLIAAVSGVAIPHIGLMSFTDMRTCIQAMNDLLGTPPSE